MKIFLEINVKQNEDYISFTSLASFRGIPSRRPTSFSTTSGYSDIKQIHQPGQLKVEITIRL